MESNYYEQFDEAPVLEDIEDEQDITTQYITTSTQHTDTTTVKPDTTTTQPDKDDTQHPASIQNTIIVSESTPSNGSSLWLIMTIIAFIIYKMRNEDNKNFNGWGVLLCILCCPQLYITYVIVDLFIN